MLSNKVLSGSLLLLLLCGFMWEHLELNFQIGTSTFGYYELEFSKDLRSFLCSAANAGPTFSKTPCFCSRVYVLTKWEKIA